MTLRPPTHPDDDPEIWILKMTKPETQPQPETDTEPTRENPLARWVAGINPNVALVVAGAVVALFMFRAPISDLIRPDHDGGPTPVVVDPQTAAAEAARAYAANLADVFDQAAEFAQTCPGNVEFYEYLHPLTTEARKSAFAPFDQVTNSAIGEDRWNAARAADLCRKFAAGFRSIE